MESWILGGKSYAQGLLKSTNRIDNNLNTKYLNYIIVSGSNRNSLTGIQCRHIQPRGASISKCSAAHSRI